MVKIDVNAKTSTKYCYVTMKLGPKITCHLLNLIAEFANYIWCTVVSVYVVEQGENLPQVGLRKGDTQKARLGKPFCSHRRCEF